MQDFLVGIASYKRPRGVRTLDYLEELGFPKERILLSVQTEEDRHAYTESGVAERVGKFLYRPASSAAGNRNTLLDSVPQKTRLLLLDDDIIELQHLDKSQKRGLKGIHNLCEFDNVVKTGFSLANKNRTVCFGVSGIQDGAWFMRPGVGTRNIVTTQFMGVCVTSLRFDGRFCPKEDYEFCCRVILHYGSCVRLNEYAVKVPKTRGGCSDIWKNKLRNRKVANAMCTIYPDIVRPNPNREGEILMVRKRG